MSRSLFFAGAQGSAWRRLLQSPWLHGLLAGVWLGMLSGVRPLTLPDEGRYAGVAWDMLRSGQHLVPLMDGMPYFHKPPLYYWLAEISMSIFGPVAWAARLPSWLAAWLAAIGLYAFLRRWRTPRVAMTGLAVLVTLPLYFGAAQFANMDMLVAACITLCTLAGVDTALRRSHGESWRAHALSAAFWAAMGVLAKGLIGVVLPGGILALWLLMRRDLKGLAALLWPPAVLCFLALALPWFILVQQQYPGFFHYFFIYQQFERFSQGGFNNGQPFWFYVPVLAGLSLPWMLWSGGLWRMRFWREDVNGLRVLMAIWIVVVVGFFSIPHSKLVGYVLPALAPIAVLLAEVVQQAWRRDDEARARTAYRLAGASLAAAMALCVAAVPVAAQHPRDSARDAAHAVRPAWLSGDVVLALHHYPFDLAFYLRAPRPFWVVDNWSRADLAWRDNWRKELHDAGGFEPGLSRALLISPKDWLTRVCEAPAGARYWVWGEAGDETRYPLLQARVPYYDGPYHRVWLLQAGDAVTRQACAETPTDATREKSLPPR